MELLKIFFVVIGYIYIWIGILRIFVFAMQMLFKGFPDECNALNSLRNGALEMGSSARWATEWEENAKPLISEASPQF